MHPAQHWSLSSESINICAPFGTNRIRCSSLAKRISHRFWPLKTFIRRYLRYFSQPKLPSLAGSFGRGFISHRFWPLKTFIRPYLRYFSQPKLPAAAGSFGRGFISHRFWPLKTFIRPYLRYFSQPKLPAAAGSFGREILINLTLYRPLLPLATLILFILKPTDYFCQSTHPFNEQEFQDLAARLARYYLTNQLRPS